MTQLRLCDLRGVVDLVGSLAELDDPRGFPTLVLPALTKLVSSEIITYNEIEPRRPDIRWEAEPPDALDASTATVFKTYMHEHPLINYYEATHDERPMKFSDLLTRHELRALGIYQDFFRPLGVEHQMAVRLSQPGELLIGIALNRGARDFSERDRELLDVLRTPIMRTLLRVRRRHRVGELLATLDPTAFSLLTPREVEILQLVAFGRTNTGIGHALDISPRTVAKHLEHIYRKLAVSSRTAAVTLTAGHVAGRA